MKRTRRDERRNRGIYLKNGADRKDAAKPEPTQRRCPVCQGLEVLAAPHQHGAAA
jgi:hypothetical protein